MALVSCSFASLIFLAWSLFSSTLFSGQPNATIGTAEKEAAVIKWFAVYIDNVPQWSWSQLAETLGVSGRFTFSVPHPNQQVPAAARGELFWVKDPAPAAIIQKNSHRVRMELCFCSLYDECWLTTDGQTTESSCKEKPKFRFAE